MKSLRVYLALFVVLAAILGALLHPLAMVLAVAPFDNRPVVAFLVELRSLIADLLGWGVLSVLAIMALYVVFGRVGASRRPFLSSVESEPSVVSAPEVVVALTAYNDAKATAQAVNDFRRQPSVVRVLVIDNNSTDDTAALAEAAGATVIREPRQGYGYACIRGLTEGLAVPDADVVLLAEGDGTFVAGDTAKFLAYVDHADLVVGNRVVRGLVDSDSQMDHFFTWGNMAVAMLLRLRFWDGRHLGPAGLTDVGCTFRAIRRPALERILPDLRVGGNHFSIDMLMVAIADGLNVVEIPIRFRKRVGRSKGASQSLLKGFQVGVSMIWHVLTFTPPQSPQVGRARESAPAPEKSASAKTGIAR
jgi:hypothetical protein